MVTSAKTLPRIKRTNVLIDFPYKDTVLVEVEDVEQVSVLETQIIEMVVTYTPKINVSSNPNLIKDIIIFIFLNNHVTTVNDFHIRTKIIPNTKNFFIIRAMDKRNKDRRGLALVKPQKVILQNIKRPTTQVRLK